MRTSKELLYQASLYAGARVQGELAYGRDAGLAQLKRHDEQAKAAWAILELELDKVDKIAAIVKEWHASDQPSGMVLVLSKIYELLEGP